MNLAFWPPLEYLLMTFLIFTACLLRISSKYPPQCIWAAWLCSNETSCRFFRLTYLGGRQWPGCFLVQRPSWLLLSSWVKAANSQGERSPSCFSRPSESTIRGQEVNFDPEIKLCSITPSSQVLWVTGAALYMLVPWTRSVAWCVGTNAIERTCLAVFSCTCRSFFKKGSKAGLEQAPLIPVCPPTGDRWSAARTPVLRSIM